MRHILTIGVVLALLLLATLAPVAHGAEKVLTEADFKKMKIKELRQFLDDRNLQCPDCQEKQDFVKFCTKHASAPVVSSTTTKAATPDDGKPLWEAWSAIAKTLCEEAADKKSVGKKDTICNAITQATDSVFMLHGKRVAAKLKKKPDALKKTSWGEPYNQAGRKMLSNLINYCLEEKNQAQCSSASNVQPLMEDKKKIKAVDFVLYLTNVGIENTNPMYEILSGGKSPGGFKTRDDL